MSVKWGMGILIVLALGPCPMTQSISKSSMAMYSISSSAGLRRWISSMKNTEFSVTLVRIPARSLGLSSAGALVIRISEPISLATIEASVVFPSPGGPIRNTWSRASPLSRAAVMKTPRFSLIFFCPWKSLRNLGLRMFSCASVSASCAEVLIIDVL